MLVGVNNNDRVDVAACMTPAQQKSRQGQQMLVHQHGLVSVNLHSRVDVAACMEDRLDR
jgi:hypothetical protein